MNMVERSAIDEVFETHSIMWIQIAYKLIKTYLDKYHKTDVRAFFHQTSKPKLLQLEVSGIDRINITELMQLDNNLRDSSSYARNYLKMTIVSSPNAQSNVQNVQELTDNQRFPLYLNFVFDIDTYETDTKIMRDLNENADQKRPTSMTLPSISDLETNELTPTFKELAQSLFAPRESLTIQLMTMLLSYIRNAYCEGLVTTIEPSQVSIDRGKDNHVYVSVPLFNIIILYDDFLRKMSAIIHQYKTHEMMDIYLDYIDPNDGGASSSHSKSSSSSTRTHRLPSSLWMVVQFHESVEINPTTASPVSKYVFKPHPNGKKYVKAIPECTTTTKKTYSPY